MNKKYLLASFIISINFHLLALLIIINKIEFNRINKNEFLFKIKVTEKKNISYDNSINKANKLDDNKIMVDTKYILIPEVVRNLTLNNDHIKGDDQDVIINSTESEAELISKEEFEIDSNYDVIFKALININEKGIVTDIKIIENNLNDQLLNDIKIKIGRLKFKPATKNGKGIESTKEINI